MSGFMFVKAANMSSLSREVNKSEEKLKHWWVNNTTLLKIFTYESHFSNYKSDSSLEALSHILNLLFCSYTTDSFVAPV